MRVYAKRDNVGDLVIVVNPGGPFAPKEFTDRVFAVKYLRQCIPMDLGNAKDVVWGACDRLLREESFEGRFQEAVS